MTTVTTARIESLHIYPVKSCRGLTLTQASLGPTGLMDDRGWLVVSARDRFLTQREVPRLATIQTALLPNGVRLSALGMSDIDIDSETRGERRKITVWRDTLEAIDAGDAAARWLSEYTQMPVRLVRFAADARRVSSREWTGEVEALNQFSDGYPILIISTASLADLNSRLPQGVGPLPMNRFRPNIVVSGVDAYAEDRIHELHGDGVRLRIVKPCTRCKITTTDQLTGEVTGEEPLTTLKSYRWSEALRGVMFGQNVISIGAGGALKQGQDLQVVWK